MEDKQIKDEVQNWILTHTSEELIEKLSNDLLICRQMKKINELQDKLSQLQQEKEDLIKWFQDNLKALENMPFAISKSAVIKEFEEGLSKLKGDDKEC